MAHPTDDPKIHILILAANPRGTSRLYLDEEVSKIEEVLNTCQYRERFTWKSDWSVTAEKLQFVLKKEKPQIVQFIGHGEGEAGLIFQSDIERHITAADHTWIDNRDFIPADALADLFELASRYVECVILNACYSEVQATAICQSINYVVGTRDRISDRVATKFSYGFYTSLGNDPRGIEVAYREGLTAVKLARLDPSPFVLKKKANPLTQSYSNSLAPSVDCHPAIALGPVPDWCAPSRT